MSVPSNSLTSRQWWAYAEHLAANHVDIAHVPDSNRAYVRMSFPELQGADFNDLASPCLIAETVESEGVDNSSNNLLAQRYLAYTIAKRVDPNGDYADRILAEDDCERIAFEVLARFREERIHRGGQVFADVKMNQWQGDLISPFLPSAWVGYRIMVPIMVSDRRLKHDAGKWSDAPGNVLLSDISGLSCPAINHPTLGLTAAQRLGCVLPQYDFSDPDTLDALTAQQETDLEAAFGDGSSGGGGTVTIVDQDNNIIQLVSAPGTYEVLVIDYIDGGAPNSTYVDTITPPAP